MITIYLNKMINSYRFRNSHNYKNNHKLVNLINLHNIINNRFNKFYNIINQ